MKIMMTESTRLKLLLASLAQLIDYRETTTNPALLERDIKIMQWISEQPDASKKAEDFFRMRYKDGDPLDRLECVKNLGWEIDL